MSEQTSLFSTVSATVISGVIVYVLGEILQITWLKPLQQYKELKARISFALSFYGNIYTNLVDLEHATDKIREDTLRISDELRQLGCELNSFVELRYRFHPLIPRPKTLKAASRELIGLSNGLFRYPHTSCDSKGSRNHDSAQKICKLLNLSPLDID